MIDCEDSLGKPANLIYFVEIESYPSNGIVEQSRDSRSIGFDWIRIDTDTQKYIQSCQCNLRESHAYYSWLTDKKARSISRNFPLK